MSAGITQEPNTPNFSDGDARAKAAAKAAQEVAVLQDKVAELTQKLKNAKEQLQNATRKRESESTLWTTLSPTRPCSDLISR